MLRGINPQKIPNGLIKCSQWVNWKAERKNNGKINKIPICPNTGRGASHSNKKTWGSFEDALKLYSKGQVTGLGFVFAETDLFCGVDLDDCKDPETSTIKSWARKIIEDFQSYTEVSPSGTGVHIIVQGQLPEGGRKNKQIEIYDRLRFFTVTGNHLDGTPPDIRPAQDAINGLLSSHFKKEDVAQAISPPSLPQVHERDSELIRKAINSRNGDKFNLLYQGRWQEAGHPSQSEGDQAFCNMLAFWTGKDAGRIDNIFRGSGLMRPKWNEKHYGDGRTYGQATIERAISGCQETYSGKRALQATETPQGGGDELYDGCSDTDSSVEG